MHVETALHVHEADPDGPVQLWCAPGHASGAPHWPFDPHVSTPVPEHRVPAGVHAVELLDAELLVVELPVLVEVTPPVIAELRELLVLVDVPVPVVPDVELP